MRVKCKYITMSGKCLKHSTPLVNEYCVESPCEDYEGFGTEKLSEELMVLKARNRQRNKKIQRLIDNLMKEHYTQHEVELLLKAAKDGNDD